MNKSLDTYRLGLLEKKVDNLYKAANVNVEWMTDVCDLLDKILNRLDKLEEVSNGVQPVNDQSA